MTAQCIGVTDMAKVVNKMKKYTEAVNYIARDEYHDFKGGGGLWPQANGDYIEMVAYIFERKEQEVYKDVKRRFNTMMKSGGN